MDTLEQETLESQSLWFHYKSKVWLDTKSEEATTVHNIMRTLRSIGNMKRLAYVSVPITSGSYYYGQKTINPTKDEGELLKDVIAHNYNQGLDLVSRVASRSNCPVLYPADLFPIRQKWKQGHFQALWLSIIAEMCTEIHMSRGWAYSNGCAEEFVHTMQLRLGLPTRPELIFFNSKEPENVARKRMKSIEVFDHSGTALTIPRALTSIEKAIGDLTDKGFEVERLRNCARLLRWTDEKIKEGFYQ